jgi:hypothetical protein
VYRELRAPAVLAFDEMLERQQLRETVVALDYAACLALRVDDFLAMISDDIQVVQGLFRTLLGSADERHHVPVHSAPRTVALAHRHTGSLKPFEKLFVLEQNPLLAGTTVNHLLDMAGIAREVTLERATTLFDETDVPAVFYVLSGTVRLERTDLHAIDARPGATIGMSAVLAGMPAGWRATVMEGGYALCLEREDLIDLLAEEVELLRYLASAILHAAPMTPMRESGSVKVA